MMTLPLVRSHLLHNSRAVHAASPLLCCSIHAGTAALCHQVGIDLPQVLGRHRQKSMSLTDETQHRVVADPLPQVGFAD